MSTHDPGLNGLSQANRKALQANIANYYLEHHTDRNQKERLELAASHFNVAVTYVRSAIRNFATPLPNCGAARRATIIKAKREGWSLTRLGNALGVCKERARILINKVHDIKVDDPKLSDAEAIKLLFSGLPDCDHKALLYAAKNTFFGVKKGRGQIRLSHLADLKAEIAHLLAPRFCRNCGKQITYGRSKWCHKSCGREYYNRNTVNRTNFTPRVQKAMDAVRQHHKKTIKQWVPLAVAVQKSKLTAAQISYYKIFNFLRIRDSKSLKWRGKPMTEYALEDVMVLAKHLRSCKRRRR